MCRNWLNRFSAMSPMSPRNEWKIQRACSKQLQMIVCWYHDECPGFIDDFSLSQSRAIVVQDPEQRDHSWIGVYLTLQVHVHVVNLASSWRARYPRTVCTTFHFFSISCALCALHILSALPLLPGSVYSITSYRFGNRSAEVFTTYLGNGK